MLPVISMIKCLSIAELFNSHYCVMICSKIYCNPLYINFVQEIVIAHTKFSDFDAPVKIAKFSNRN